MASTMVLRSLCLLLSILPVLCRAKEADLSRRQGSIRRRVQDTVTAEVYIKFDDFPPETGWSIVNADTQEDVVRYNILTYPLGQTELYENVTLDAGQDYVFTIVDGFADGMSGGSFYIKLNDFFLVQGDGDFSASQSISFTAAESQTTATATPGASPTPAPVASPTATTDVPSGSEGSFSPTASILVNVTVEIIFDSFPAETGWSIVNSATNETIANVSIGTYEYGLENVTETVTVTTGQNYTLTLYDRFGDGICCTSPGSFAVRQDKKVLVRGNGTDIASRLDVEFTPFYPILSSPSAPTTTAPAAPSPTGEPTAFSPSTSSPSVPVPSPTENPSTLPPTLVPDEMPTATSPVVDGSGMEVEVIVHIVFDNFPGETGWYITAPNGTRIVEFLPGSYALPETEVFTPVLVSAGSEYNFTIVDFFSDGFSGGRYEILQGDIVLVSGDGGSFTESDTVPFIPGNPPPTVSPSPVAPTASPGPVAGTTAPTFASGATTTSPSPVAPTASPGPVAGTTAVPTSPTTSSGSTMEVQVVVHLVFDTFPWETSWYITAPNGTRIIDTPTGTYNLTQTEVFESVMVTVGTEYNFTVEDFFSDGISGGRYEILQGEIVLASGDGGNFTTIVTVPFIPLDPSAPTASPVASTIAPTSGSQPVTIATPTTPSSEFAGTLAPIDVNDDGTVDIVFELVFDGFPEEVSWTLKDVDNGTVIDSSPEGGYAPVEASINEVYRLDAGATYEFVIQDSGGDGLCCSAGYFQFTQQGVVLGRGDGNFGSSTSSTFTPNDGEDTPGSNATDAPTASTSPSDSPAGSVNVTVLLVFDQFPEEIGWSIVENATGVEIISVPIATYPLLTETGTETVSLIPGTLYNFTIVDFFGDGLTARGRNTSGSYLILQDEGTSTLTLVEGNPDFGFNETIQFSPASL